MKGPAILCLYAFLGFSVLGAIRELSLYEFAEEKAGI
jgi:hypothetical protein